MDASRVAGARQKIEATPDRLNTGWMQAGLPEPDRKYVEATPDRLNTGWMQAGLPEPDRKWRQLRIDSIQDGCKQGCWSQTENGGNSR